MLQFIREKSQGWFAWTIVIAICLTFALWGIHSYLYGNASEETVAKVNGIKISQDDLSRDYNQLKQEMLMRFGPDSSQQISNDVLKKMALQSLISSIVVNQGITDAGFAISHSSLEGIIAKMPVFQEHGQFSKTRFEQIMTNSLFSPDMFLQQLRESFLMNQLRDSVTNSYFILPTEVQQTVELMNEKRSFDYLIINTNALIKQVTLSDSEIQNYYKNHQDQFRIPEKVSLQYIRLSLKDLIQKVQPTEEQLKQFYQNNVQSYRKPFDEVKNRVIQAYKQQKAQTQFDDFNEKLANITYESPNSLKPAAEQLHLTINSTPLFAQSGTAKEGILQYPSIIQAAFSDDVLNQRNNSEPINIGDNDVTVIRVLNHIPNSVKSYEVVRPMIAKILMADKAQEKAQEIGQALVNALQKQPNLRFELAKKQGLVWNSVILTDANNKNLDPEILDAAFMLPKTPDHNKTISMQGFTLKNGHFAIVVLKNIELGSPSLTEQQKDNLAKNLEKSYGSMEYQLYETELMNKARIKYATDENQNLDQSDDY